MRPQLPFLALAAVLTACSGGPDAQVDPDDPVPTVPDPGPPTNPIDPDDCVDDMEQFEIAVSPLLQSDCITCHVSNGIAGDTEHLLVPDTVANHLETNRAMLEPLALQDFEGASYLVQKALGLAGHGGGPRIQADSPEFDALHELAWRFANPDSCDPDVPDADPDVPVTPLRRLTESQLQNTVEDLWPGVDMPVISVVTDPLVHGYDNNGETQAPTALLISEIRDMSLAVTTAAMEDPSWIGCDLDADPLDTVCVHDLLLEFGDRAFRRPLSVDEELAFTGFFDDLNTELEDPRAALQLTLQAFLNSPSFLYLPEWGADPSIPAGERVALDDWEVASRLSYFLWNSMPDDALFDAAAAGALSTPDQIETEAWRMLEDPRAERAVGNFHRLWLELDEVLHIDPDPATYPQWQTSMRTAARAEIDQLVWESAFGDDPTLSHLLLDRTTIADPELAVLYGLAETDTTLPADQRSGFLTRVGWLGATSHPVFPSPVQRGVFVLERMLCVPPPDPPADIDTSLSEEDPINVVTNRDRYEVHSSDPSCFGCHESIDGIGFGFENYDGIGVYRTEDNGAPVDATGELVTGDLDGTSYEGALELSQLLAGSETVHQCVARQWYRYALGRSDALGDEATLSAIGDTYWAAGGDLPTLLVAITRSESFRTRRAE
jgi:hypothetical protein